MSTLEDPARPHADPEAVLAGRGDIEGRSLGQIAWRRLKRDKVAIAGAVFIVFLFLVAIFAPLIVKLLGGPPNEFHQDLIDTAGGDMPDGQLRRHELGPPDGLETGQRPGHLQPGRVRRPDLVADRDPRDSALGRHRHDSRHRRRLLRWLGRRGHEPADGHLPGVPAPGVRDRARGRLPRQGVRSPGSRCGSGCWSS